LFLGTEMAYTEFHKSYGDFEVVIAPVDFSCLDKFGARLTVNALREYEAGFVCHVLEYRQLYEAKDCIGFMLEACYKCYTVDEVVSATHPGLYAEGRCPHLFSGTPSGIAFRKAWVKHLISDIVREHGLEIAD
jgi:hypothetical protein